MWYNIQEMSDNMSLFITLEGIDGCGKSSIMEGIKSYLDTLDREFVVTRDPGGTDIANQIRQVILDPVNTLMTDKTEAMLYAASRCQMFHEVIEPALMTGKIVLADRYIDSSMVYQGIGRGLGIDKVLELNSFVTHRMPDLTIFIDVSPEITIPRIAKNRDELDRLESLDMSFYNDVYNAYREVASSFRDRIKVVDGNQPLESLIEDCLSIVRNFLE